jgi:hypothetical protein
MAEFNKTWEKLKEKAVAGNDSIFRYSCNQNGISFAIGNKEVKSVVFLFLIKYKDSKKLIGYVNGEFLCYQNENEVEEDVEKIYVNVMFDDRKRKLLVDSNKKHFIFSEDEKTEDLQVMVFEGNQHFSEIIMVYPDVSSEPAFILDDSNTLYTFAFSLIHQLFGYLPTELKNIIGG